MCDSWAVDEGQGQSLFEDSSVGPEAWIVCIEGELVKHHGMNGKPPTDRGLVDSENV